MQESSDYLVMDGKKFDKEDMSSLVGAYQGTFNTTSGSQVMDDLRLFSRIEEPFGCALSHEEFAYRAGLQDMFKYIEALASTED